MTAGQKLFSVTIFILFSVIIIAFLNYSPPILDRQEYNLPARIYNFFAYAYYSTQVQWMENMDRDQAVRRAAALAAWHRPSRMMQLLGIKPDDFFQLGQEYAALGLEEEADQFFRMSFPDALYNKDRALDIISYLAILGDWQETGRSAEQLLEVWPESAEANYWSGRALVENGQLSEAISFLHKAYKLDKSLIDSLYQKARAYEKLGKKYQGLRQYEEVASLSPNHKGTWQALSRLYGYNEEIQKKQQADLMLSKLSPPTLEDISYENMFIVVGYNLKRKEIFTGDVIQIDIYFKGWRFQPMIIQPEIVFIDQTSRKVRDRLEAVKIICHGEVIKRTLHVKVPVYLAPGPIRLTISFREPQEDLQIRMNRTARNDYILPPLNLNPRWIIPATKENLVQQYFGENARPLKKKTVLACGSGLHLDFDEEDKIIALGLVSCIICPSHNRDCLYQGQTIAHILVEAENGEQINFAIKVGEHTSDLYWDAPKPISPRHKKVQVFRSCIARWCKPNFAAHEYYTKYSFPIPLKLKSLKIECVGAGLVLQISDLILIPER